MSSEDTCIPGFSDMVSLVTGTASCTQCEEDNWIEIKATDKDTGEPIPNLLYTIFDTSLEELASGVLDENGEARHEIPVENIEVIVLFGTDEAIEKAIEQIETLQTKQALQDNAVSEWRGIPAGLDEQGFNQAYDRIVSENSDYGETNDSFLETISKLSPASQALDAMSSAYDFVSSGFNLNYMYDKNRRQNFEEYQIATNARQATDGESFLGGTDQGLSFGFSEEIMAGLDSLLSDRTYEELLEERRQLQRAQQTANPNWYIGGEIAGTVPTIFIPVGGAAAAGARGATTAGRAALQGATRALPAGVGLGGLSGFGHGEGLEDRLCGALEGAVIGGALSFLLSGAGVLIARSASKAKIWVRFRRARAFPKESGDPARRVMGPARQSHPEELAQMKAEMEAAGVKIREIPGRTDMAYSPGRLGKPGELIMDPDASYAAWKHEYTHFLQDKNSGWRGIESLLDKNTRWRWEQEAYAAEMSVVRRAGHMDLIEEIMSLRTEEWNRIFRGQ